MLKEENKSVISEWVANEAQSKLLAFRSNDYFKPNKIEELKSIMSKVDLGVITNFKNDTEYYEWLEETEGWFHNAILPFYKKDVEKMNNSPRSITSRFLYEYVSCQIALIYSKAELFDEKISQNPILVEQFQDIAWDLDILKIAEIGNYEFS